MPAQEQASAARRSKFSIPPHPTLRRPTTATQPHLSSQQQEWDSLGQNYPYRPLLAQQSRDPSPQPPLIQKPPSPGGNDSSPFFFSPPSVDPAPATASPLTAVNPRKRPFPDDAPPPASRDSAYDYEYGSESQPQSRRLSVMELCNDDAGILLSSTLSAEPRPTPSGLVSSASALALVDRPSPTLTASPVYPRSSHLRNTH